LQPSGAHVVSSSASNERIAARPILIRKARVFWSESLRHWHANGVVAREPGLPSPADDGSE